MAFKAIEPAHGGFASGRDVRAHLGRRKAVMVTHRTRRRVAKSPSCAAAFARVEITTQGDEGAGNRGANTAQRTP
jgi:hypothetical protein